MTGLPKPPTQFDCLHSRVLYTEPDRRQNCAVCNLGADWLVKHLTMRHGVSTIVVGPMDMHRAGQFHRELHAKYPQDHDDLWLGPTPTDGDKPKCPCCGVRGQADPSECSTCLDKGCEGHPIGRGMLNPDEAIADLRSILSDTA